MLHSFTIFVGRVPDTDTIDYTYIVRRCLCMFRVFVVVVCAHVFSVFGVERATINAWCAFQPIRSVVSRPSV